MSRTRTYAPTRTQLKPGVPTGPDGGVVCSGHKKKAAFFTAGPTSKNPGRSFYTCPLGRDDEKRCKFFKWADELDTDSAPSTSKAAALAAKTNTLGQEPRTLQTPTKQTETPFYTPQSNIHEADEIDWDKVDTDSIEREAIARTPTATQESQSQSHTPGRTPFQSKLLEAVEEGRRDAKRKRETTPERAAENPFLSSPAFTSPPHRFLAGTLDSLSDLSEHIHRQDRLLAAADKAKDGFRRTIKNLQDKNEELENRVKELERQLGQ